MLIPFLKMHAQGNDFILLDGFQNKLNLFTEGQYRALAANICKVHTAVGADGLVLIHPAKASDAQMIIYNSDGSRAEMCGSAMRCVSYLLSQKLSKRSLKIQTDSGIKNASVTAQGMVTVNLGLPQILLPGYTALGFAGDLVDIGNHHYIVWQDDLSGNPHLVHGAALEHHCGFAHPVNAHFARVISPTEIEIKIWEHACGATLACGTGAASAVYSGIYRGMLENNVTVNMPGGAVNVTATSSGYMLSGEVATSFNGVYDWKT